MMQQKCRKGLNSYHVSAFLNLIGVEGKKINFKDCSSSESLHLKNSQCEEIKSNNVLTCH